jgi:two-component system, chemotaxis family, protein-glutamate methylesterase/glutaminase
MKLAPFGRSLDLSLDWIANGPDAGVIQFFFRDDLIGLGCFSEMRAESDLEKLSLQLPANDFSVKIVCSKKMRLTIEKFCFRKRWNILKVVERLGAYEVQFLAKNRKLQVTQEDLATTAENQRVKVLIVDDSPTIRKFLEKILSSDTDIEVVGSVGLPSEVETSIEKFKPNVITLDIHLPEMNGVDLLKKYLKNFPIPTIMISSISLEEGPLVLNALEAGAVDYIQKPSFGEIAQISPLIIAKVKAASLAKVRLPGLSESTKNLANTKNKGLDSSRLLAIGSSTGGTEALKEVFLRMPADIPPTVVVQHIPAVFSKAFADRLNELCPFEVIEGKDGDEVIPGRVIIAPGGKQMKVKKIGKGWKIVIDDSPPVNRHKPSVDFLFDSVAKEAGASAVGVILTGMGADGAKGLKQMHDLGSFTIAQNQESCVVFGMPQAAIKIGAAEKVSPLSEIAEEITKEYSKARRKAG